MQQMVVVMVVVVVVVRDERCMQQQRVCHRCLSAGLRVERVDAGRRCSRRGRV